MCVHGCVREACVKDTWKAPVSVMLNKFMDSVHHCTPYRSLGFCVTGIKKKCCPETQDLPHTLRTLPLSQLFTFTLPRSHHGKYSIDFHCFNLIKDRLKLNTRHEEGMKGLIHELQNLDIDVIQVPVMTVLLRTNNVNWSSYLDKGLKKPNFS